MNEEILRNAIRKVIEESPAFKEHFRVKETPLESTEAVSEEEELEEAGDWWEGEDFSNIGQDVAKASAVLEKNPQMDAAIEQYVQKILANPNATEKVLAQADKLGVSQGDEAATIALKTTQQGNIKEVFGAAGPGEGSPEGEAAETAGMALGLGGAIASSLAAGGYGLLAAGFGPAAILAGGALAGHIMKRVLDAASEHRVQGLAGSVDQQELAEEETEEPLKEWYDNSLFKKLLKESIRRKK